MNPESELKSIEQQERLLANVTKQVEGWKPQPVKFQQEGLQHEFNGFVQRHFEPTDNLCFCLIHPTLKIARNIFRRADQLDRSFVDFLHEQNEVYNVYVAMNAYDPALAGETIGRTEQNVVAVRNLYAEVDERGEQTIQKITASANVPSRVTDILESSPGKYQFMWRVEDMPKDLAKATNRAIASEFDTDMASTDLARVLRVPGFKNVKYQERPVVKIVAQNPAKFNRDEFKITIGGSSAQDTPLEDITSVIGSVDTRLDGPPIPRGQHDRTLFRIGCSKRSEGWEYDQIKEYLVQACQARCVNYGSDFVDMCEKKAKSACTYPKGQPAPPVLIGGKGAGQLAPVEIIEIPKLNKVPYPEFPSWCMQGTSLYEHFVKPVCEQNSRIPYFMFLPAAALMMNYLGTKVKVENRSLIPSFFMVLIGEKGRAIKSSSVEDAIEYLHEAGVMDHADSSTTTESTRVAGGKSLVWTVGSPEGLGLEMQRTNCRNAVLFYDELSGLISKTEIDSSSLKSSLLSLYESSKFSNTIKSRRENYSINPRTYCASLIACTTDENFEDQWSRLTGKSSGLDDRFMFLLQPKELQPLKPHTWVNTVEGAAETKKRIDKAVQQSIYRFEDTTYLENMIGTLGNRTEIRAEKWALYFAIDLGHDIITESDVDRGLAIAKYEKQVKAYLGSPEAETKIAAAQIKYRRTLERKFDGRALVRDMERTMSSHRYGTEGWDRIYRGLKQAGIIAEIGTGVPGCPKEVVVRVPLDE